MTDGLMRGGIVGYDSFLAFVVCRWLGPGLTDGVSVLGEASLGVLVENFCIRNRQCFRG